MEANACWWKRATHRLSASRSFRRCPFQRADHRNTLAGDTDPIAWHRYVPAETADLCRKQPNHTFFSPPHSDPSQDRTIWSFGRGMEREGGAGWKRFAGQASEREDGSEWESERGRDARNESTRATVRASGVKMRRTGVAQARPLVQGRRRSQLRAEAACRCVPLSRDTSARFGNAVPRQSCSGEDAARVKRRDRQAIRKGGDRDKDRECKSGRSVVDTITDSFAYWMLDRSLIIFLGYVMSIVNNTNRCCYGYIEQLWLLYL